MDDLRKRFSDLDWANKVKELNILVVGAGGIGSWTTLLLSRAGFNSITIIDDDMVEAVNLGGQFYSIEDIGTPKVLALHDALQIYSNYDIKYHYGKIQPIESESSININNSKLGYYDIIIGAVDNMETRKYLFESWESNGKEKSVFIDGRLLAEVFQIFTIDKKDSISIERYKESYLFDDKDVDDVPCTSKATSYYGAGIAFEINKKVISWIRNEFLNGVDDLPFEVKNYGFLC